MKLEAVGEQVPGIAPPGGDHRDGTRFAEILDRVRAGTPAPIPLADVSPIAPTAAPAPASEYAGVTGQPQTSASGIAHVPAAKPKGFLQRLVEGIGQFVKALLEGIRNLFTGNRSPRAPVATPQADSMAHAARDTLEVRL